MPLFSQRELARRSRDRSFLIRASIACVVAAAAIATMISLAVQPEKRKDRMLRQIDEYVRQNETTKPETAEDWARQLRTGSAVERGPYDCRALRYSGSTTPSAEAEDAKDPETESGEGDAPDSDGFPLEKVRADHPDAAPQLAALHLGLRRGRPDRAIERLEALPVGAPFRDAFLGDLHFVADRPGEALEHYLAAAEADAASRYVHRSAVVAAQRSGERERLRELVRRSEFRDAFAPSEQLAWLTDARDWAGLARATIAMEARSLATVFVIPALFTAAVWFLILMPFWEIGRARVTAALLAFVAGMFSAALTLFAVMIQERAQGWVFHPNDTPIAQFLYFVAGVGLREETLKLLCAAPFAFWAARRGSELEGMILAAVVGLGFAFQENLVYFESNPNTYVAWVRFLTANALHLSLTGIAGYYLCRTFRRRGRGWEEFLAAFIAVVLAHGIYNSVLSLPMLSSYSPLAPILVALIAYRLFDPLRSLMDTTAVHRRISPLGVFVLGSVVLTCVVFVASSAVMPFRSALAAFASSVGGMAPVAFAFISRFRDL